jgi:hypothetical protein
MLSKCHAGSQKVHLARRSLHRKEGKGNEKSDLSSFDKLDKL